MKKIRYCCRNFKQGTKGVYRALKEEHHGLKQKKRGCLGHCKLCSQACFAVVGKSKKLVSASSAEALQKKLEKAIS
ncbi:MULTISPECIES: DUF1450 domain-containing protein [Paenibacillus]|uniref:DUF1450 domain-containing protein n=1 Tax=Paenibacillus TaxID=44249 RepID=UPI0022B9224B|nr:DUF1450 domain-containing protein [Paenibacillus caseinilyticus]MCZ8523619.1 DUF1450 domain-containing protein [Paenibacillus caseinilyticus]